MSDPKPTDPDAGRPVADIVECENGNHIVLFEDGTRCVITPAEREAWKGKQD
jgi:hypothetical protein